MERTSDLAPVPAQPFQFTIRSLLWFTLSVAMVLAFVRPANSQLLPVAFGAALGGIVLGTLVGWQFSRVFDAIFWSLLAMSLATICLAGQYHVGLVPLLGWPFVGVFAGAIAGGFPPGRIVPKTAASIAAGIMPLLVLTRLRPTLEQWGDVVLAAFVACLLVALSELFTWARARYHTSYGAWAASLVFAVILGNYGAVWFQPILSDLLERR